MPFLKGQVLKANPCSGAPRSIRRSSRTTALRIGAFHEAEEIKDWRVRQMVTLCHTYFEKLWSKGDTQLVANILDRDFVHNENIWRRKKLIVGPEAMADWVAKTKRAYPDLLIEAVDFGSGSTEHLFVQFEGRGTNLGEIRGKPPTRHNSRFTGVSTFRFNHDRSRIVSVDVWRTPMMEDQIGGIDSTDVLQVHLSRLHFD